MQEHHLWKDYFHFSRKERIALLVLMFTIVLLIFLPRFFKPQIPGPQLDLLAMDSLNTRPISSAPAKSPNAATYNTPPPAAIHLFKFNPNTITEAGLLQLGLRSKTAITLIHYREKGGRFRKPDDLRKIYGLHPEEADRLIPYVSIPSQDQALLSRNTSLQPATSLEQQPAALGQPSASTGQPLPSTGQQPTHTSHPLSPSSPATASGASSTPSYTWSPSRKLAPGKQLAPTNINTATAADWKKFPGIGEVLSKRIVAFRNKLGGFQSVYQLQQTYGLPDSVFTLMLPYLYLDSTTAIPPAVKTGIRKPANAAYTPALLQISPAVSWYKPAVLNTKPAVPEMPARYMFRRKLVWNPVLPLDPSPL